jgi:hypothetical protein
MEGSRRFRGCYLGSIASLALSTRVVIDNAVLGEIVSVGRPGVKEAHSNAGTIFGQIRRARLVDPDTLLPAVNPELPKDRWGDALGSSDCAKSLPHLPAVVALFLDYVQCHEASAERAATVV